MLTNCKNCGAPLKDMKCEYCGTEYDYIPSIGSMERVIKININGVVRRFYIGKVEVEPIYYDIPRTIDGERHCTKIEHEPNIRLTMVSY